MMTWLGKAKTTKPPRPAESAPGAEPAGIDKTSQEAHVDKDIIYIGMDLGTYKTSVASSTGTRDTFLSAVGWPKDQIARRMLGRDVILGLRPERITDKRGAHGDDSRLQPIEVKVDVIEPTGPDTLVFAQVNGKRVVSRVHPASNPQPLANTTLLFDTSKAVLFDPANEERIA